MIEVRNLTGEASQAGADLRADLHVHVQPPPRRVRLSEAAPTCHTHAPVSPFCCIEGMCFMVWGLRQDRAVCTDPLV